MSEVVLNHRLLLTTDLPDYAGIPLSGVRLVTTAALAHEALEALMTEDVVGFDTESKPTFLKGEVSTGPHLVQLSTEVCAYLFPVSFSPGACVVKTVLESHGVLKAGFGLGNDRSALKSKMGVELINVIDLGEILRGAGHRGTVGAKVAVAHFFGERLQKSKKIGTSNWANARLTERQLLYAANDAHVALKLYHAWRSAEKDS